MSAGAAAPRPHLYIVRNHFLLLVLLVLVIAAAALLAALAYRGITTRFAPG